MPNEEETAFVARLRAGNEEAFRDLVSKYYGSLLRLAMSFVSERAAAEEVVQETWLGVIPVSYTHLTLPTTPYV